MYIIIINIVISVPSRGGVRQPGAFSAGLTAFFSQLRPQPVSHDNCRPRGGSLFSVPRPSHSWSWTMTRPAESVVPHFAGTDRPDPGSDWKTDQWPLKLTEIAASGLPFLTGEWLTEIVMITWRQQLTRALRPPEAWLVTFRSVT